MIEQEVYMAFRGDVMVQLLNRHHIATSVWTCSVIWDKVGLFPAGQVISVATCNLVEMKFD